MLKQLKNISVVSIGNIFNSILGLLFISAVSRTLTIDDFGKYAILTSVLVAASTLSTFGTNSVYVSKSLIDKVTKYSTFLGLRLCLLIITIPITIILLHILGIDSWYFFAVSILGLIAYLINLTIFAVFQKNEQFLYAVSVNFLPALFKGTFGVLILLGLVKVNLQTAYLIFCSSVLLSAGLYFLLPVEYKRIKITFDFLQLFKKSVPVGISQLIGTGWPALNNAVVKFTNAFFEVGIFSVGEKIAQTFNLLSISIFTVLLPKNAKRKQQNLSYDFKESIIISLGLIILGFISILFLKPFISIVFGEKYLIVIPVTIVLIASHVLSGIHSFMNNYLLVEDKNIQIMNLSVFKLLIFLICAGILISKYGLIGVAIAEFCAALVTLCLLIVLIVTNQKKLSVKVHQFEIE